MKNRVTNAPVAEREQGGENADTQCPIARSTAIVGDRWTTLILRELFSGSFRFDEIQAQTGATAQMLAARLKRLEADGMVERQAYSRRPPRYEYRLTKMGQDFYPVIFALRAWGETWCKGEDEAVAVRMTHRDCGGEVALDGFCPICGKIVPRSEMDAESSPEYAEERARRHAAHKERVR